MTPSVGTFALSGIGLGRLADGDEVGGVRQERYEREEAYGSMEDQDAYVQSGRFLS